MKKTFGSRATEFFVNLKTPGRLTHGVTVMNPYENEITSKLVKQFYKEYFNDNNKRIYIIGINPGRFGGGVTGIGFTDPINLEVKCGIKNNLDKKPELSSRFVYSLIDSFGGVKRFYEKFFISAVYPLALIKEGRNYNFYDSEKIYKSLKPEIIRLLNQQISFGAENRAVICLGKKNEKYLKEINEELKFWKQIITFDHPRFIMQYRLKKLDQYLEKYITVLNSF
ncbi:MAG: DUF4918 family protein [Melioribacteraceae bacterium]|nr:DUF4918 family protein [Melioribacteraceae bacterium]MCF8353594.1 DUF4918 family protein [Melioribacteraceae bacterium]MCF8393517.1 DUF4918 family protein [Melioribacteraceae bacterium]MCF8419327.1 DUF4918 family protein [Melioribacteraceae bacterium]